MFLLLAPVILPRESQKTLLHTKMMNCIPYSPGRGRFNPRVIDANDDDDSVQEFLKAHPCIVEREKAQEFETSLGQAISMAERDSGSLLALQHMNRMNVIEMGRRISSLRSMQEAPAPYGEEDDLKYVQNLASARSFHTTASLPTFLKVEKGNPAILTQKSWESIDYCTDTEESDMGDEEGIVPGVPSPTPARTRSWNKLRQTLDKEERDAKLSSKRSGNRFRGSIFRRKAQDATTHQSVAKEAPVEVALQSQKKKGWGRLRRNKAKQPKQTSEERQDQLAAVPVSPIRIPDEMSRDAEEEDFFVNDANNVSKDTDSSMDLMENEEEPVAEQQPRELATFQEEEKDEYDCDPMNVSYEEAQSMEIFYQEMPRMCGLGSGPGFDIIGTSALLKGLETSWRDLTEDSFDIVPRLK
jgi:hypothetical protein